MTQVQLRYEIEALTPLHIGTGYGLAGVADAGALRRLEGGRPGAVYLPGSSIKGRARYHLELLAPSLQGVAGLAGFGQDPDHRDHPCRDGNLCPACNIFGSTAHEGPLFFSDALLATDDDLAMVIEGNDDQGQEQVRRLYERQVRTNVMLSRRRGVAREQHLFTTEVAAPGLRFRGTIGGFLPDQGRRLAVGDGTAPLDLALLLLALRAITHLGGRKSRGLGACRVAVEVEALAGRRPAWSAQDLLVALREVMP